MASWSRSSSPLRREHRARRAPGPTTRGSGEPRAGRHRHRRSARCWAPARSTTASTSGGRGCSAGGLRAARVGRDRRARRAGARRLDADAAARAAVYAEGSGLVLAAALRPLPPLGPPRDRLLRVAPARRAAAAEEKYAGLRILALSAVADEPPKLVLAVIDGAEAGDARARDRDGPGARRWRRSRARDRRPRLRRGVPVRDAGLRGDDRDRRAPGPPPHPGDELVVARRAALRRVRVVVRRRQALRDQPPARPTPSTT